MLMMVAGTKNGEILRGLIALRYSLYSASMVPRPPMPAPQIDAAAGRVGPGEIEPGVGDGLHAGGDAVVHELVHAPGFLGRDVLADIEVAHLAADAHWKGRHVEACHRADAALTAQHGVPCRLDGAPDRRHHSQTRYDDPALAHDIPEGALAGSGLARRSLM